MVPPKNAVHPSHDESVLRSLIAQYPEHPVAQIARDILHAPNAGRIPPDSTESLMNP